MTPLGPHLGCSVLSTPAQLGQDICIDVGRLAPDRRTTAQTNNAAHASRRSVSVLAQLQQQLPTPAKTAWMKHAADCALHLALHSLEWKHSFSQAMHTHLTPGLTSCCCSCCVICLLTRLSFSLPWSSNLSSLMEKPRLTLKHDTEQRHAGRQAGRGSARTCPQTAQRCGAS